MKTDDRTPGPLSVFFPSLSNEILWKLPPVSRVRYAAQKTRALDTGATFQQDPPDKKAKGRSSELKTPAGFTLPAQTHTLTPSALAYCGQKLVLTMGSTLATRTRR